MPIPDEKHKFKINEVIPEDNKIVPLGSTQYFTQIPGEGGGKKTYRLQTDQDPMGYWKDVIFNVTGDSELTAFIKQDVLGEAAQVKILFEESIPGKQPWALKGDRSPLPKEATGDGNTPPLTSGPPYWSGPNGY